MPEAENQKSTPAPNPGQARTKGDRDRDVRQNRMYAALGYVWLVSLVMMLVKKDSRFVQFHAKQGLTIALIMTAAMVVMGTINAYWFLNWLWIILQIINAVFVITSLIGLIQAAQGKYWQVPVIGKWAFRIFGHS